MIAVSACFLAALLNGCSADVRQIGSHSLSTGSVEKVARVDGGWTVRQVPVIDADHGQDIPVGLAMPAPVAAAIEPSMVDAARVARARAGGAYKIGKPYVVNGMSFTPRKDATYDQVGIASYYGARHHGTKTANGETYDEGLLTAAHPTLPLPSLAYVTNLTNNRTVLVRLNDRGPFVRGRIVDVSGRVAELLGMKHKGIAKVRVKYAGPAPVGGDSETEEAYVARQPWINGNQLQIRPRMAKGGAVGGHGLTSTTSPR
jgi:rare lipoprotein A (peptidoglycan hydrolase)